MLHINLFIDKIKMLESKRAPQLIMSLREAKDLHGDITKLLLVLEDQQTKQVESTKVQSVELTGGDF